MNAIQYDGTNIQEILKFCPRTFYYDEGFGEGNELYFCSLGRDIRIKHGQYIVKDKFGGFQICDIIGES